MPLRHFPSESLPAAFWAGDAALVGARLGDLQARLGDAHGARSLAAWFRDYDELIAATQEECTWREIAVRADTDDPRAIAEWRSWHDQVVPRIEPLIDRIEARWIDHSHFAELAVGDLALPLMQRARVARSRRRDDDRSAARTSREVCDAYDRAMRDHRRQRARCRARGEDLAERNVATRRQVDPLFDRLLATRRNEHHRECRECELGSEASTRDAREALVDAIERLVVPALDRLPTRTTRPPRSTATLVADGIAVLERVDPRFGELLRTLIDDPVLDFEPRPGKTPGSVQFTLPVLRLPYIVMLPRGNGADLDECLHEFGHALHTIACRELPFLGQRRPPVAMAELASTTIELLAGPALVAVYPRYRDVARARMAQLEDLLERLAWIARIERFETWVAAHPDHDAEERQMFWETTAAHRAGRDAQWFECPQLFHAPCYTFEYGIAILGAIDLWRRHRDDPRETLDDFWRALSLGSTRSAAELYAIAGAGFDPAGERLVGAVDTILDELELLRSATR